jgi:DNA invertase Pin-like site-specific DNA recombinase
VQFERKLIAERANAGLEAACASGSVSGRKPLLNAKHVEKLELARTLVRGGNSPAGYGTQVALTL